MKKKGILIIISGFSGAGKGTVVKELMKKGDYTLSISATTRPARAYEAHGREYFFESRETFEDMIANDALIEWATYCDHYYGTPKQFVEEQMAEGKDVILEIEMQGALNVKALYPDSVLVFITAPKVQELKDRLEGRGTESQDVIHKRLLRSYEETAVMERYDYLIVNDKIDQCVEDIKAIIHVEHKVSRRNKELIQQLRNEFEELLKGEV
ncbi:guanylate kinase [Vallitalea pronyensis]|uniref:Guanylate kinase n=1 Tax=Vallitalea pronyensis TaxID=1348613 RepID=A0A8J8SH19_9FIRM|nr:guanylate kinase [Vallitalea pronyensis]QUI22918.1 guanylate kinase [Vallitalea pronyensis]